DAGRGKGYPGTTSHLCPRARAGEAVTTPPNMPTRAPSATITPIRLTAIPPSRHHPRDRRRALSSTRRTRRGGHNRPCPLYHSLRETSTVLCLAGSRHARDENPRTNHVTQECCPPRETPEGAKTTTPDDVLNTIDDILAAW